MGKRRTHAGMHSVTGEQSQSKHMRRWQWQASDGSLHGLLTPLRRHSGRVVDGGRQYAVESGATKRRPWQVRKENRARNKAARASRKRNR